MKVLHVVPYYSDEFGGPPIVVRQLGEQLASQGLSVDIISTDELLPESSRSLYEWEQDPNSTVTLRRKLFKTVSTLPHQISPSLAWWCWSHVQHYDLVHIHCLFCFPPMVAAWACRRRKVPYVFTLHGTIQSWALAYKRTKKRVFLSLGGVELLSGAAAIHCLSEETKDNLNTMGVTAPKFVLPNGIDPELYKKQEKSDDILAELLPQLARAPYVLFMGRLDPKKGLDHLIRGFAHFLNSAPGFKLVLAGPDLIGFKEKVEQWIREEAIEEHTILPGMVSGKLKQALLHNARCFVLPSRSEGSSIALLEAMSAGLPCLYSKECFCKAHLTDSGVELEEPLDQAIAMELKKLHSDPARQRTLTLNAQNFVRVHHDWKVISAQLAERYKEIVKKPEDTQE